MSVIPLLSYWHDFLSKEKLSVEQWPTLSTAQQATLLEKFEQRRAEELDKLADAFPELDNANPLSLKKQKRELIRFIIIYIERILYFIREQLIQAEALLEQHKHKIRHRHDTPYFNFPDEETETKIQDAGFIPLVQIPRIMNELFYAIKQKQDEIDHLQETQQALIEKRRKFKKSYLNVLQTLIQTLLVQHNIAMTASQDLSPLLIPIYTTAKLYPQFNTPILYAGIFRQYLNLSPQESLQFASHFEEQCKIEALKPLQERLSLGTQIQETRYALAQTQHEQNVLFGMVKQIDAHLDLLATQDPTLNRYLEQLKAATSQALSQQDARPENEKWATETLSYPEIKQSPFEMTPSFSGKKHEREEDEERLHPSPSLKRSHRSEE